MEDSLPSAAGSRRRSFRRLKLVLFAVNALILIGLVIAAYGLDLLDGSELDTIDARFEIRGDRGAPADVVVVEIDDVSFDELDQAWPFPRSLHAEAIDRLRSAGARVIAYDIQFTEPTKPAEDNALISAVDRADGVVLATTEVGQGGQTNVFGGDQVLRETGARAGNSNYVNDSDGVIRRQPYAVEGLESFAVVAAEEFGGRRLPVREGFEWIDFRGPPGAVESVPFSRLVAGRTPPDFFRDKVVVIGATAPSLQDVHPTAVGGDTPMSGPEIQANAIATVLDDFPLQSAPGALNVALIVLLGLVGPGIAIALGPIRAAICGALLAALYAVAVQLAFNGGLIVGDAANFVNSTRLKGIHLAMRSGMLAAEVIFEALKAGDYSVKQLQKYEQVVNDSWIVPELRKVRNFHAAFKHGRWLGLCNAGLQFVTGGRAWGIFDRDAAVDINRTRNIRISQLTKPVERVLAEERRQLRGRAGHPEACRLQHPDGGLRRAGVEVLVEGVGEEQDRPPVRVGDAARQHEAVVVVRIRLLHRLVDGEGVGLVQVIEGLDLSALRGDQLWLAAGLLYVLPGSGELDLLHALVRHQECDSPALDLVSHVSVPSGLQLLL